MKILFFSDNFPPEVNAPATRTAEHCKIWVQQGHQVTVITCFPNFPTGKIFPGYRQRLWKEEDHHGIRVVRLWTYMAHNRGVIRRIMDYSSFGICSFFAGLFVKADLIVATSPQLFAAVSGRLVASIKRTPWIMEVRDLWPESIVAVGALKNPRIIRWLSKIEMSLYRNARDIVVVTESFKEKICAKGIKAQKVHIIKNGVDQQFLDHKGDHKQPEELQKIIRPDRFLVGYIGTHGMAHGLELVVHAAKHVADQVDFILIGDGSEKARLVRMVKEKEIDNVYFLDQIPKKVVPIYLREFHAVLVPLRKSELFKTVIPSKIFESAAMHKPILLGVQGEAKKLVEQYGAGRAFIPGDTEDFLAKLEVIRANPDLYRSIQQGGAALAADFDRSTLAMEMLNIIQNYDPAA